MNEPGDVRGPRWFARPIVWLCGGGLVLMLIGVAAWWAARTGVRAMQRRGAELSWEVSDVAYWAEANLGISTDVWLWDGNVTTLYAGGGGPFFGSAWVELDDAGLLELRRFRNLTGLNFTTNSATDAGIERLLDTGGLQHLSRLELYDCHSFSGRGLAMFSRLPNLESLWIASSPLSVSGADLSSFTQLHALHIDSNPLTNTDFDAIARLPQLDWLVLCDTAIDDAGLAALAHCPQLTELDLSGSRVSDAGVVEIASHCPNLVSLWLEGTEVTDACLSAVEQLPKLEALYVGGTAVTEAAAKRVMAAHPGIVVTVDGEAEE